MPKLSKLLFAILLVFITTTVKSQVLISLLLGDKLNSDKIEFGLIGGMNWSNLPDLQGAKPHSNFNLGFYFHFKMQENSYFSTGVLVKSDLGATGMDTYEIGIQEFDSVFADGTLTKKISYFHVPILYHYRIKKLVYLEAGFMAGLRGKAYDEFNKSAFGGDVQYTKEIRKEFQPIDIGLLGGLGVKFKKQTKSMSVGVRYYYGLTNISSLDGVSYRNTSFYLFCKVPIGVGKDKSKED